MLKEIFALTNNHMILATPLIIFSMLASIYLLFSLHGNLISVLASLLLLFLMLAAFLSGWFYMIKVCVEEPERENAFSLLKEFTPGVGEYFLPVIGVLLISGTAVISMSTLTHIIGMKFIGSPGISVSELAGALKSNESLRYFLSTLTDAQLLKLFVWNLLTYASFGVQCFLLLFYYPSLLFKTKNPLKALWYSLCNLLSRNIFKNLLFFIILAFTYMITSICVSMFAANKLLYLFALMVYFYYFVFAAVAIFKYYYENYVRSGSGFDRIV